MCVVGGGRAGVIMLTFIFDLTVLSLFDYCVIIYPLLIDEKIARDSPLPKKSRNRSPPLKGGGKRASGASSRWS